MSQLVLMVTRIDDFDKPDLLTEVWRQVLPMVDATDIVPAQHLDQLENTVTTVGWEAMRTLLVEQWRLTDQELVQRFRQAHPSATVGDGYDTLKVVSRLGVVQLPRQVCYSPGAAEHCLPGNAGLPEHAGPVTTRGLQEWACLLPQDLPFVTAERLLGWMTHDPASPSATQVRRLVCQHGQIIRAAEQAEVEKLLQRPNLAGLTAQLREVGAPRRPAAWAAELNQAVETALAQPDPAPPAGITAPDWERVVAVRRAEPAVHAEQLRRLGPVVPPGAVVASVDEVEVRRPEKRRFLEWGTAYVRTAQGCRYLSGSLGLVLRQLRLLLLLCGQGGPTPVTLLGDGARWITRFFLDQLATWPLATLILDWYHCRKKCYDLTSMICRGRQAKTELLRQLLRQLWRGQVAAALTLLEEYRPQAKNGEKLDELIAYLQARQAYIPDYQARRAQRQYIGSAHAEKGNDLLVARRQKHQGMHWRETTSGALVALRTLMLNGGWDLYWQKHQVLPLAVPSTA